MSLASLPPEILVSILSYLSVQDFLSTVRTNRFLYQLRDEHTFWRERATQDFKIPPQPLFETDGARWQWLYKTIQTQSVVYTWGSNKDGNLGQPNLPNRPVAEGWPQPMHGVTGPSGIGSVVDVQCGGWSTVLMNSYGKLFAAGVINGERIQWQSTRSAEATIVPVTMPMKPKRKWLLDVSHRSMSQFSVGRSRLLALSDKGEVIEWTLNFTVAGTMLSVDHLHPDVQYEKEPKATQVVAGWAHGSALYPGYGLYYWRDILKTEQENPLVNHILSFGSEESLCVPGTRSGGEIEKGSLEESMGKVKKYIVLEHYILILTDLGKLFAWRTASTSGDGDSGPDFSSTIPREMTNFYPESGRGSVLDVQGSFRSFAVFHSTGTILTGKLSEDDLPNPPRFLESDDELTEAQLSHPETNPVLQGAGVIQLAFGDYYYHALHLNGEVTSYGRDSHGSERRLCGALGLGTRFRNLLRGVQGPGTNNPGDLTVHPESDGRRRVWFETEKFTWMCIMLDKFISTLQMDENLQRIMRDENAAFAQTYGEWFEQEGQQWSLGPVDEQSRPIDRAIQKSQDLPTYFPIKITAAGWSSAAVLLVDKERAEQTRKRYLLPEYQEKVSAEGKKEQEATIQEGCVSWGTWLVSLTQRLQLMADGGDAGEPDRRSCMEADCYVWSQQDFPRLRLPGDDSLIEGREPTRWKFGEPAWLR